MAARLRWGIVVLLSLVLPALVWLVTGALSDSDVGPGPGIALVPAVGVVLCVILVVRGPRAASPLLVVATLGWVAALVAFAWPDPDGSIGLGFVLMAGLGVVVLSTLPAMLVLPRPGAPAPRGGEAGQTPAD